MKNLNSIQATPSLKRKESLYSKTVTSADDIITNQDTSSTLPSEGTGEPQGGVLSSVQSSQKLSPPPVAKNPNDGKNFKFCLRLRWVFYSNLARYSRLAPNSSYGFASFPQILKVFREKKCFHWQKFFCYSFL